MRENSPICDCKVGYFDDMTENPDCQKCEDKCITCAGMAHNCTECAYLREGIPHCGCKYGYV
jgi:hypothetical protein